MRLGTWGSKAALVILRQAIDCGVPAANHAFKEAGAIVKEVGKAAFAAPCPQR